RVLLPVAEFAFLAVEQTLMEGEILVLRHRAVDVVLVPLVPARRHPANVHVDAVAVDDRRDRVEEGERVRTRGRADRFGEKRRGERSGGDDGLARSWQGVDPLPNDF